MTKANPEKFNRRLMDARAELGLGRDAMAAALGLNARTYQAYELGDRDVPGVVWVALRAVENGLGECDCGF